MKQAINTRTQEEYDALMRYYESKGIKWVTGKNATDPNHFWLREEDTVVLFDFHGEKELSTDSAKEAKIQGYTIIPFTEFAKANIVEEKSEGLTQEEFDTLKYVLIKFLDEIKDHDLNPEFLKEDERTSEDFVNIFFETNDIKPFGKFDSIVQPDYKALYLKGRELLERVCDAYTAETNEQDEVEHNIKLYLTKHKDGE